MNNMNAAAARAPVANRSDKDKLIGAVMELRALGYWAREAQRDGAKAVPEDVLKRGGKWVVTDERENGKFNADGNLGGLVDTERGVPKDCTLHVHHQSRDAAEIVTVLRQHGLDAAIVNEGDCDEVVVYPTLV